MVCNICKEDLPKAKFKKIKVIVQGEARYTYDDTCEDCLTSKIGKPIPEFKYKGPHIRNSNTSRAVKQRKKRDVVEPGYELNLINYGHCRSSYWAKTHREEINRKKRERYANDKKYREKEKLRYWIRKNKLKTKTKKA